MLVPSTDQRGWVSLAECCVSRRGFASLAVEIDQPQVGAAAVRVEIGFALHVNDVACRSAKPADR